MHRSGDSFDTASRNSGYRAGVHSCVGARDGRGQRCSGDQVTWIDQLLALHMNSSCILCVAGGGFHQDALIAWQSFAL